MRIKDFENRFSGHVPGLQGAKAAFAVLVPLIHRNGEPHLLFEVRSDNLGRQPGDAWSLEKRPSNALCGKQRKSFPFRAMPFAPSPSSISYIINPAL